MASTPRTKWTVTRRSARMRRKTPWAIATGAETTRMPLRMRAMPTPTSPPSTADTAAASAVADASAVSGRSNGVGTPDASSATRSVRPWSSASTARLQPASGAASAKTIEIATSTSTGPYRWRPYSNSRSVRAEAPPPGWTDMGEFLLAAPDAMGVRTAGKRFPNRSRPDESSAVGARLRLDDPELRDLAIASPGKESGEVVRRPSLTPNPDRLPHRRAVQKRRAAQRSERASSCSTARAEGCGMARLSRSWPGRSGGSLSGTSAPPASVLLEDQRHADAQRAKPHALLEDVGRERLVERVRRLQGQKRPDPAVGEAASAEGMGPAPEGQERHALTIDGRAQHGITTTEAHPEPHYPDGRVVTGEIEPADVVDPRTLAVRADHAASDRERLAAKACL